MKKFLIFLMAVVFVFISAWGISSSNMSLRPNMTMKVPVGAAPASGSLIMTVGGDHVITIGAPTNLVII